MCTTVGFPYEDGFVFGRTLEIGIKMDNQIVYVPRNSEDFIKTKNGDFSTKYSTIGTAFSMIQAFGDGINEKGLMGSSNLMPKYATFSDEIVDGKINLETSSAFDYLLTRCRDVREVIEQARKLIIVKGEGEAAEMSSSMHFFFMDTKGEKVVLEPKDGKLACYENPYGVLTNSPEFPWHTTNLKNYINLKAENVEQGDFNGTSLSKLGEGSGLVGLPGDFTPPSRFVRAAYFVSNTPKDLDRNKAILQAFRILSQSDIPTGAVKDPNNNNDDQTLYTGVMDSKKQAYFVKCHDNIDIQSFYLDDYKDVKQVKFLELKKEMDL